MHKIFTT